MENKRKEETKKITDAIDVVCLNCIEDTINSSEVCCRCPVRKLSESLN